MTDRTAHISNYRSGNRELTAEFRKILAVILLLTIAKCFFACNQIQAQTMWQSAQDGNWSSASTWVQNTVPPTNSTIAQVDIDHNVTLDQIADVDVLNMNANTLTISGAYTLNVNGTASIANGATLENSSDNAGLVTIANFVVTDGGNYVHNAPGSSANGASTDFPGSVTRSFGANSNVTIKKWANGGNAPAALPASGNPGWGNLTIDVSNLAGNWLQQQASSLNLRRIQGDFNVKSTGSYYFGLQNNISGALTIGGNVNISGGSFLILSNGSGKASYVTINGDLNLLNNGKFQITTGSFNIFSTSEIYIYLKGNLTISNSAQILQPTSFGLITVIDFCKPSGVQYFNSHSAGINSSYIGWGIGDITKAGGTSNTLQLNDNFLANNISVFRIYNKATLRCPNELYVSGVASTLTLDGDPGGFTLFSGGSIEIGSKDGISIAGTNLGNIRSGGVRNYNAAANYIYNGSYNQVTGNGLPSTISGSVIIDNSGATNDNIVTMNNGGSSISGSFDLNNGILATSSSNLLTITNRATGAISRVAAIDENFVSGPLQRYTSTSSAGAYMFPLGKTSPAARYKPLTLTTVNNIAAGGNFTGEYFYADPPLVNSDAFLSNLIGIQENEYWQLDRNAGSTTGKITIPYTNPAGLWRGASGSAISPCGSCYVGVVKRTTNSGAGNWDFTAPTSSLSTSGTQPELLPFLNSGDLVSAELSGFSPFTAGFYYDAILPARLLDFNGKLLNSDAILSWTVSEDRDVASFEIQQSLDGNDFSRLTEVKPNGTKTYTYVDPNIEPGNHYYRLLIKEKNEEMIFSNVVLLNLGKWQTRIIGLQENPVRANLSVMIVSASQQKITATVTDTRGRVIKHREGQLLTGQNQWNIPSQMLAKGLYFMQLQTGDGENAIFRFVKE